MTVTLFPGIYYFALLSGDVIAKPLSTFKINCRGCVTSGKAVLTHGEPRIMMFCCTGIAQVMTDVRTVGITPSALCNDK